MDLTAALPTLPEGQHRRGTYVAANDRLGDDAVVGFRDRLRPRRASSRTMDALTLYAGGTLSIVGESHYQDALAKVSTIATSAEPYLPELKGRAKGIAQRESDRLWFRAALFREPDNPYDPQAVAVHATGVGPVGYLDRDAARDYAPVFEELARQGYAIGACPAMLSGGGAGKSWGVVLCVSPPDVVLSDLRSPAHDD